MDLFKFYKGNSLKTYLNYFSQMVCPILSLITALCIIFTDTLEKIERVLDIY